MKKNNENIKKSEIAAGGFITRHNPHTNRLEILLVLSKNYDGYWGFPKGHVEKNENLMQTAIREIKEETGLDVVIKNKNKVWISTYYPFPNVLKTVTYFWCEPKNINMKLIKQKSEISKLIWTDCEVAKLFLTYENDQNILSNFIKDIKSMKHH